MLAHGGDQRAAARRKRDVLFDHVVDRLDRQALEQRHPLAQRRLEGNIAAHRALGDGRDLLLQSGIVGQFVEAFLADHGRIHVGEQQRLAPINRGLHHDVDGHAERAAQAVGQRALVGTRFRAKGNVGGNARREPDRLAGVR